ncbi:MAG: MBL fold metallo-hydrolase [Candidatus Hermodarchaeia archaeon]
MQKPFADFQLLKSRNIAIRAGEQRILFDPTSIPNKWRSKNTTICISHAHADHIAGFRSALRKLVTPETLEIYKSISVKPIKVHPIQTGQKFSFEDGGTIQLHRAGHMLGAAQFVFERNGSRLVYTGDFNLQSTLTAQGAEPIPCDVLLMEATYGRPDAIFPPREQVYAEIAEWTSQELKRKKVPMFRVYATGKAQEIIRIINTYLTAPVIVDSTIAKISKVYKSFEIPLDFYNERSTEGREMMRQGGFVYLSSKNLPANKTLFGQPVSKAVATGWARIFPMKKYDKAFILSAHADFHQLVEYVKQSQPRAVHLTCGNTVTFGAVLDKLNIKQIEPRQRKQLELSDFL